MHYVFAKKTSVGPSGSTDPPGSFALCESEAAATKRPVGTEINLRYGEIKNWLKKAAPSESLETALIFFYFV
ncbi:hypothetical protein [Lysinibacillus sp. NPDC093216]|uniref:hypothetical protein n=1 Tax=Lysinibacillus sp. NPDC093216 TaxID=3390576 RepID=UPI003D0842FB